MTNLKEIDSAKLLFNIHDQDLVEQITEKIPEFGEYDGKVPIRKVCLYIILMADKNSPMLYEIPDFFKRKYIVATMCGFPKKKDRFTEEAETILLGKDHCVNRMHVAYLLYHGLPEYTSLVAYIALNSNETQKIISGAGNKDSIKVIDETQDRIERLTRVVFRSGNYDESTELRNALYAQIQKDRPNLRPEALVRQLETLGKLDPTFCPYGEENADLTSNNEMFFVGDHE